MAITNRKTRKRRRITNATKMRETGHQSSKFTVKHVTSIDKLKVLTAGTSRTGRIPIDMQAARYSIVITAEGDRKYEEDWKQKCKKGGIHRD